MRIAFLSDIHGNDVALQAVLADVERRSIDRVVCLGDVSTLGPDPVAALRRLRRLGCPCVTGNHDEYLLQPDAIRSYTDEPVVLEAVDWARGRLSSGDLAFVATFVPFLTLELAPEVELLAFHGTPSSNVGLLLAETPPSEVDRILSGHRAAVLVGGHTHIQMLRQHRGRLLVNPGSVGMPFREYVGAAEPSLLQHAEYGVIEVVSSGAEPGPSLSVALHRVPLSHDALRAAAEASESPLRDFLVRQYE